MPTARDNRFQSLAQRLLATQKSMNYIRVSISETLDPETLKAGARVSTYIPIKARISKYKAASIDGKNILDRDLQLLVAATVLVGSIKPNNDKVEIDGVQYSVIDHTDLYADEEIVTREIQIRK